MATHTHLHAATWRRHKARTKPQTPSKTHGLDPQSACTMPETTPFEMLSLPRPSTLKLCLVALQEVSYVSIVPWTPSLLFPSNILPSPPVAMQAVSYVKTVPLTSANSISACKPLSIFRHCSRSLSLVCTRCLVGTKYCRDTRL